MTKQPANYIVDTHCHLDLVEQQGLNIDDVIAHSLANNVKILQTICTRVTQIDTILSYTKKHDFIYASVGVHPCNVAEEPKVSAEELIKICAENPKIIGIGETGLDYYHDTSAIENQKISFIEHIKASQETGLPLIIHSRAADEDMMCILEEQQGIKKFPALLHCFSSSKELAEKALELGIYVSISGIVTFKSALQLQEIVKSIPLEFLLVETDSPYLAPVPNRGKTNQPGFTRHVAEYIADLKDLQHDDVISKTTENFFRIFTRAKEL